MEIIAISVYNVKIKLNFVDEFFLGLIRSSVLAAIGGIPPIENAP